MGSVTEVKTKKGNKEYKKYVWIVPKQLIDRYDIKDLEFNGIEGDTMKLIITKGRN